MPQQSSPSRTRFSEQVAGCVATFPPIQVCYNVRRRIDVSAGKGARTGPQRTEIVVVWRRVYCPLQNDVIFVWGSLVRRKQHVCPSTDDGRLPNFRFSERHYCQRILRRRHVMIRFNLWRSFRGHDWHKGHITYWSKVGLTWPSLSAMTSVSWSRYLSTTKHPKLRRSYQKCAARPWKSGGTFPETHSVMLVSPLWRLQMWQDIWCWLKFHRCTTPLDWSALLFKEVSYYIKRQHEWDFFGMTRSLKVCSKTGCLGWSLYRGLNTSGFRDALFQVSSLMDQ